MNMKAILNAYSEMLHYEITAKDDIASVRPFLAHYTSLESLENILENKEFWLSNPLDMNDWEEVSFGVDNGVDIAASHEGLKQALGTEERIRTFYQALNDAHKSFADEHVLDLYIMCFSHHQPSDDGDGRLSMWRGYGNAGKGAAIVFDTSKVTFLDYSPLVWAPVVYDDTETRMKNIQDKITQVAEFIENNPIPDDAIAVFGTELFKRFCLYAIFSKHIGFGEEKEWRLVYFKDRDRGKQLTQHFGYFNGHDGIQPKLKLPAKPIGKVIHDDLVLSEIVHSIIVGPASSSPLTKHAIERMLEQIKMPKLKAKLRMSTIPFRP